MIVYNGSVVEITKPLILANEIGRDFGFAFYTTDIREQAERWAVRKAKIERQRNINAKPVVNVYEWDESTLCNIKAFDGPSMEWLDMVLKFRSDISYKHIYDIVIGKIANDNVGETISYVMQGIMSKEDAIERLKFERINNQIAFCTEKALEHLTFVNSYEVN